MSLAQKVEALRDKFGVETGSSWLFIIASGFKFMGFEPEPGAAALRVRVGAARGGRRGGAERRVERVCQALPAVCMGGFLASRGQNPCQVS